MAKLFASLVSRATPEAAARPGAKTLADPCRAHALLLAKKELCFARSLVEDAPETIRGRVPLPDGADAAVSEECYLATELLFARQDECPLPALANAPPLHICAADAIKRVGDKRLSGQDKRAKFPTSKAHISAVFHSFRLIFGRAIVSRNGLEAWMLFLERARAKHSR